MSRTCHPNPTAVLGAILLAAAVAACGGSAASAAGSAPALTGAPTAAANASTAASAAAPGSSGSGSSDQAGGASTTGGATAGNDRCAMFSTTQVNTLTADAPFQTADPVMLDVPGCQWYFNSGVGNVNLQVLPGSQFGDWTGKPGVTAVSGVGDSAFVGPFPLGGTMAGATSGGNFYFLTVSPAPPNDVAVAFLKAAIAQLGGG